MTPLPYDDAGVPMKAARRIIIEHDDGSRHDFSRLGDTHGWHLDLTTPPELEATTLLVTGYGRFDVARVVVNCLDGDG